MNRLYRRYGALGESSIARLVKTMFYGSVQEGMQFQQPNFKSIEDY